MDAMNEIGILISHKSNQTAEIRMATNPPNRLVGLSWMDRRFLRLESSVIKDEGVMATSQQHKNTNKQTVTGCQKDTKKSDKNTNYSAENYIQKTKPEIEFVKYIYKSGLSIILQKNCR
jgi:hypothetical protein